jgi:5-formyltetrahydrofolate cyclo-ligase
LNADLQTQKEAIRAEAKTRRLALPNKDALSTCILERFFALEEFSAAKTVLLYVGTRTEVRTLSGFPFVLQTGKCIAVPFCENDDLQLFRLEDLSELKAGAFGILEPRSSLRRMTAKLIEPTEVDLVQVPGIAFDRNGGRLGHGKGFYDRLLKRCRHDAAFVGLAFDCQLFPEIPMSPIDVPMDFVVTESSIYRRG